MRRPALVLIGFVMLFPAMAKAQTITATVTVGTGFTQPSSNVVVVNPVTNKIYVTNPGGNTVTVIDGATNTTTTVPVGSTPVAASVNTVTNKIYISNAGSSNVTVIDGATNATTTVATGANPDSAAVNPVTNKIYVSNQGSANVTVIDGATNATTTIAAGANPLPAAVNPVTNKIYVGNNHGSSVTVIDGATNTTTTVATGTGPDGVAVNPVTNKIYVPNFNDSTVTVIDGATNATTTLAVGANPLGVGLNPVTNKIYVSNYNGGTVTVIDGATNATATVAAGTNPLSVAVNAVTNTIFVTNQNSNNVTVIDGATNNTVTLALPTALDGVAVNPVTDKIYVRSLNSNSLTVIDGATNATAVATDPNATGPVAVAVNPATGKIYVANNGSNNVTVINSATNGTTTVAAGTAPSAVAVNSVTNKIYVANNGSSNVTVIDGATNATTTVATGVSPAAVAVNPVTNKIYVANLGSSGSSNVTVIDGATNATSTVAVGSNPHGVAVNPVTNKIYVASFNGGNVTVIDGASNATTTVKDPNATGPQAVAVNPVTNKVYVANENSANITVIDGATNATTTIALPGVNSPTGVDVNPITNKIYVVESVSPVGSVTVIDGATNSIAAVAVGNFPVALVVNPTSNKIYVSNDSNSNDVTVIDGATNSTSTVAAGGGMGLAVNPATNQVYATSSNVAVISEQQLQAIPITTTITALPGNATTDTTPTFSFSASSNFAPTAPSVNALYFQLDTWQGPWIPATSTGGGNFSGTAPTLTLGTHILFAFATDGRDSTSVLTTIFGGCSPLTGAISSYLFVVTNASGPGPATHFSVSAQSTATAGTGFNVTATALDASNNTATGYAGTVHFTSSDGQAVLPSDSTLTSGVGMFSATLNTSGAQTITATDSVTASITGTSGTITVSAATFPLTVVTAGTGTGTVTGNGISCTSGSTTNCTLNLAAGTAVALTEGGTNGSTFAGWSATPTACNVSGAMCAFSMPTGAETVTATFTAGTGPTLLFITVTPRPTTAAVGATVQFTATGTFSDSSTQNLTATATWSSSNTTVATVSNASGSQGLATLLHAGGTAITATQSMISGSAGLGTPFAGRFQAGDLLASDGFGLVEIFTTTGTPLGTLNTGQGLSAGMAFDTTGNLFVTTFSTTGVVEFDPTGKLVGPFGSGYTGNPESILFNLAGDAFVGAAQNQPMNPVPVFEFDSTGKSIAIFQVVPQDRGSDWVELLKDQKTFLYTSEGTSIKSFNVSTKTQNPDFAVNLPGVSAFALRQLPDGDILVADSTAALLLNGTTGAIKTTYTPSGAPQSVFALNLDPDGTSFWTADLSTGVIYKFDIASGAQLISFTEGSDFASGLAIFGEKAAGTNNLTVTKAGTGTGTVSSTPAGINCGSVCVAPFADNTSVTLTAIPDTGSTFGGFSANCTPPTPQTNPPTCTVPIVTSDVSATATFTSSGPTLKSIAVTPATATIAVNGTQQFTATGTFSDNSTKDVTTQSTWSSSNTEVATVGAGTGIAKGVGVGGPITITATDAGISGTAQLTVSNVPFTLTINPPPGGVFGPVAPGGTLPVGVILTAIPGTTGTVTFGCTTSSPTITCSPQPSSVTLSQNGPLQVAIVVNTFCKGPVTTGQVVPPGGFGGGIGLLLLSTMLAGVVWMYRRNPRWAVSFALFVLIALGGVACNSLPRNPNGVTLPGNYQLFITATFNGQTVTAPVVNFVVN
jgi:YVTN family beta-propeller protein